MSDLPALPLVALLSALAACSSEPPASEPPQVAPETVTVAPSAASTGGAPAASVAPSAASTGGAPAASVALPGSAATPSSSPPASPPSSAAAAHAPHDCGPRPPDACVHGTPGGTCGDALMRPVCEAGAWRCPAGAIATSQCACLGKPAPGCVCTPQGFSCNKKPGGVLDERH